MMRAIVGLAVAAALLVGACDFNLTDPNSPRAIGPNATAGQVSAAAVGILAAFRFDYSSWVLKAGIIGREDYRLDGADPRFTIELLAGPLDPSNAAFGGGQWQREYRTIQSGYTILNVIGSAQIPDSQKNAVRAFVQTIQALSFLIILDAHTEDSIPLDVNRTADKPLAPFVSNDSAYKAVIAILDSARDSLKSASTFPFDLGPGFVGFNTPATFLKFNRALAARVRAYQASLGALPANTYATSWTSCPACWDSVLTALGQSFIDPAAPLDVGAYVAYGTGNQDVPNDLSQDPATAIQLAHPLLKDSAELQSGSTTLLDKRFLAKVTNRPKPFPLACLSSDLSWIRYPTPISSIPIIRNEELFLLRAEANLNKGGVGLTAAANDINFIRTTSGGLDPITNLGSQSPDSILNVLLKQRFYSLLYEGGHRWIDMRRYGKLSQIKIDRPKGCAASGIPPDTVFSTLPINSFEVQARQ